MLFDSPRIYIANSETPQSKNLQIGNYFEFPSPGPTLEDDKTV